MTPKEILIAARKLIERPEHWTKWVLARNADGKKVMIVSSGPTCFCASGAIMRIAGVGSPKSFDAIHAFERAAESAYITVFNDTHTHAEVLAAFDRAIAGCPS